MRSAALTAALLAACLIPRTADSRTPRGAAKTGFSIAAEYRADLIDYDDREREYFRERARLLLDGGSAAFTHVYLPGPREHRYTWHLHLRSFSPYVDCLLGSYRINFGSGLLIGKKKIITPDPFARTPMSSFGDAFTPDDSGNPLFCFRGAAGGVTVPIQDVSISFRGFFSFKQRFIREDSRGIPATADSFTTILSARRKDYRRSEPVELNDCGGAVAVRAGDHCLFQAYCLFTGIRIPGGGPVVWDTCRRDIHAGEKALGGFGLFGRYRDDYITIFIEVVSPWRTITTLPRGRRTSRSHGIQFGLAFRHPTCSISFTGRTTGKHFYAPYAAASVRGGSGWCAAISSRPIRLLRLGGSVFFERQTPPAGYHRYLSLKQRERVFLLVGSPRTGRLTAAVAALQHETNGRRRRDLRLSSSFCLMALRSVLFRAAGAAQHRESRGWSGSVGGGVTLSALRCLGISFEYTRFFIAPDNPLYTGTMRYRDAIARAATIDRTANLVAGRMSIRWSDVRIEARCRHRFSGRRARQTRFEVSGYCFL